MTSLSGCDCSKAPGRLRHLTEVKGVKPRLKKSLIKELAWALKELAWALGR
jgi:hypothetical protein